MIPKEPNSSMTNKRNSLSLNAQVYQQLLKKLNAVQPGQQAKSPNRKYTRLEYLDPFLELIVITNDNLQRKKITVATRNISRGGMSLLHSNFIYTGTTITTNLRRIDGTFHEITGKVCRCEHRGGIVHEIGIEFQTQIVVQEFIRADITDCLRSFELIDPTKLEGKVLIVGTDKSVIPLVREHLQVSSLNFGFVENAKDALDKNYREYDLIFSCLDAGDMSGPELARHLRDIGYKRPIILSGKGESDAVKKQVLISSADMFLPTPFTENDILCAFGEFLIIDWSECQLKDIRTSDNADTLDALKIELADLGLALTKQHKNDDPVQVYITCTNIRNTASCLGIKSLHDLTHTVCEEIAQTGDLSEFEAELSKIEILCTDTSSDSKDAA